MTRTGFEGTARPSREESEGTYGVSVTLYQADGVTPRQGATVKLTNKKNGETVTGTTNASGVVEFVLDDLTTQYEAGDLIEVEQVISQDDMEYYVCLNGDATTVAGWIQVQNTTKYEIGVASSARVILNLTRNPDSLDDIDITTDS